MVLQLHGNRTYQCNRPKQLHGHVVDQRYRGSNLQLRKKHDHAISATINGISAGFRNTG